MTTLYHGNQQEAAAEVASRLEERVATLGLWLVLCSPGQVAELLRRFQPQSLCTHASWLLCDPLKVFSLACIQVERGFWLSFRNVSYLFVTVWRPWWFSCRQKEVNGAEERSRPNSALQPLNGGWCCVLIVRLRKKWTEKRKEEGNFLFCFSLYSCFYRVWCLRVSVFIMAAKYVVGGPRTRFLSLRSPLHKQTHKCSAYRQEKWQWGDIICDKQCPVVYLQPFKTILWCNQYSVLWTEARGCGFPMTYWPIESSRMGVMGENFYVVWQLSKLKPLS